MTPLPRTHRHKSHKSQFNMTVSADPCKFVLEGVTFPAETVIQPSRRHETLSVDLIVGNGPPGSISFTLGCGGGSINSVKRSKTLPTGVFATSRPRGWGLLVTERCVLNHHNWTGSFKMKRFEIFCSDPFTHQMARERTKRGMLRPVRHWTWR